MNVMKDRVDGIRSEVVKGQPSYILKSNRVYLALTKVGAQMAPVVFQPDTAKPIEPFAVAPWAEEPLERDIPPVIRGLRGDWFCCAFGENRPRPGGIPLLPHGETANGKWSALGFEASSEGSWIRLGIDLPVQGGSCKAITALRSDETVIYQRHDFEGLTGALAPGHHATLAVPGPDGTARVSFSRHIWAGTGPESTERGDSRGRSYFAAWEVLPDLERAQGADGTATNACIYPARRGYEDTIMLCADPTATLAWSAVTVPTEEYVFFTLRNAAQLASTVVWFSNGGRHYSPWNGRHVNVLGIEDVTSFFTVGLEESRRDNFLTRQGIRTCLRPDELGRISIPYIQGVTRIPSVFDRLRTVAVDENGLILRSDSGSEVSVRCHVDFLGTGVLPGLNFASAE